MKKNILYLLFTVSLFFFFSCSPNETLSPKPSDLFPKPKTIGFPIKKDTAQLSFAEHYQPIHLTTSVGLKTASPNTYSIKKNKIPLPKDLKREEISNSVFLEQDRYIHPKKSDNRHPDTTLHHEPTIVTYIERGKKLNITYPSTQRASPMTYYNSNTENFLHLDVEQGLPSSYIFSVFQDSRSDFWFGTYGEGVTKYDGKTFETYSTKNGFPHNIIMSIIEDYQGNIWFATFGGGIVKYDGSDFYQYTTKEGLNSNIVYALYQDSNNKLWIGTSDGVAQYYEGRITAYKNKDGIKNNNVLSICEDVDNNICLGTKTGLYKIIGKANPLTKKTTATKHLKINSLHQDDQGSLWIGSNQGLYKLQKDILISYTQIPELSHRILSITSTPDGTVWVGTNGDGTTRINGNSYENLSTDHGLSNTKIRTITADNNDNLWFGTYGGGISKFTPNSFKYYKENNALTTIIRSIQEDSRGNYWFGNQSRGVTRYVDSTFVQYSEEQGFCNDKILAIEEDSEGNMWFGSYQSGIIKLSNNEFTHYSDSLNITQHITAIYQDSKNNIWFGTNGDGLIKYNGNTFERCIFPINDSKINILDITEDSNGNLLLGTLSRGLFILSNHQWTVYNVDNGILSNIVRNILFDKSGEIWLGSEQGITIIGANKMSYLTTNEGLSNSNIWSITEDLRGNKWVSTENGLNIIKKNTLGHEYNITQYNKSKGLRGLDFFLNSALIDSKGTGWWGSGKGITRIDINKHKFDNSRLTPELNAILINDTPYDFRKSPPEGASFSHIEKFSNIPANLTIPWKSNHLKFRFSAQNWTNQNQIFYSYYIPGTDRHWSTPSLDQWADYRNISFGHHTLKIRATSSNSNWGPELTYTFTVQPPWWASNYSIVLFILLIIAIIIITIHQRTKQLRKRQLYLKKRIKVATKEILQQNTKINDSMKYASYLQNIILPSKETVKIHTYDTFIYFNPKESVSGDFYWFESKDNISYIAVADCTGHGIPGAMISMVCSGALDRALRNKSIVSPADLLDKTKKYVTKSFTQQNVSIRDGMDIALCAFENDTLKFSGANNPLWIIRKTEYLTKEDEQFVAKISSSTHSILIYKGDRQPIGYSEKDIAFSQQEIKLIKGDLCYIFSDGYRDQFGGPSDKKYKLIPFMKLMLRISQLPLEEQENILHEEFIQWKGKTEQTDDVTILGIKI